MSDLPSPNPVMEKIVDWGNNYVNAQKIAAAYNQKGGWEGWVQVELAIVLQQHFGGDGQATVLREQYVYNGTQQRCDILIDTKKYNGEHFTNMFELKCESSGNAGNFRTEVEKDCTKIGGGVWKCSPCTWWIVGFGVTQDIGDLKVKGVNLKKYHRDIQVGERRVTLWWAKGSN